MVRTENIKNIRIYQNLKVREKIMRFETKNQMHRVWRKRNVTMVQCTGIKKKKIPVHVSFI